MEKKDSLVTKGEKGHLYNLAKEVKHPIVEIGSYCGASTVSLAKGSINGNKVKVYAVDLWDINYPDEKRICAESTGTNRWNFNDSAVWNNFLENINAEKVAENIVPVKAHSKEIAKVWKQKIGLLFIDGDHSYRGCLADYKGFARWVILDGYLCFHDCHARGVKRVIEEKIIPSDEWETVVHEERLFITKRIKDKI